MMILKNVLQHRSEFIVFIILSLTNSCECRTVEQATPDVEHSDTYSKNHLKEVEQPRETFELFDQSSSNRFFISDYTFSINFLPFLLLLKVAFFLGVLMKDFLAKEMKQFLESKDEFPVEMFYQTPPHYGYDYKSSITRNDNQEKFSEYIIDGTKNKLEDQSFAYLAFKTTTAFLGSAAKSASDFIFGDEIFPSHPPEPKFYNPEQPEAYEDYDKQTNEVEEDVDQHLGANPGPPYVTTYQLTPEIFPNVVTPVPKDYIQSGRPNNDLNDLSQLKKFQKPTSTLTSTSTPSQYDPTSLAYDPVTKTLFVPKDISEALSIQDGTVLPLPHDLLRQAVSEGQIQIVGENDVKGFSKSGRSDSEPREQVRDLLHFRPVGHPVTFQKIMKEKLGFNNIQFNPEGLKSYLSSRDSSQYQVLNGNYDNYRVNLVTIDQPSSIRKPIY